MMIDRHPEGCIGNGLTPMGINPHQITCETVLLHGLSLPATSIILAPNGGYGMGDRNPEPLADQTFINQDCANDQTNYGNDPDDNLSVGETHNYLEFEVETAHQLGWYLTVLATEYELLTQNEKFDQAQKTLEEIFLALQAYRRLDITANCLVKKRYDEITAHFESTTCSLWEGLIERTGTCLCSNKYEIGPCKDRSEHFDIPCKEYCDWQPDLSGYSGFFIREDATQALEALHDPSENKWNIDLVSSGYAMSLSPPCDPEPAFSQPCYMLHEGRFLSSDQLFVVMMGLAMVKRFVPESATVTTCEGEVYHPLEIAQNIAKGFVDLPQNSTRHIFWPGSDDRDCCYKPVKFSECNGGNFQTLYAGVEYMYNYINPEDKQDIGAWDRAKWSLMMATSLGTVPVFSNSNGNFALEAMTFAADWGNLNGPKRNQLRRGGRDLEKEIFLLMNDVVFPEYPHNVKSEEDKDIFRQMLCDAPCGGPCVRPFGYDYLVDNIGFPTFDCANTPGWTGQRWEGPPHSSSNWDPTETYKARQFNGLDYMALYNLYMLNYPEEQTPFTDPASFHDGDDHLLGESQILGPSFMCPFGTGTFTLVPSYSPPPNYPPSVIQALIWKPSDHFALSSLTANPTNATFAFPGEQGYPIIAADFEEARPIQQWSPVEPAHSMQGYVLSPENGAFVTDVCQLSYAKHIEFGTNPYHVTTELDHCAQDYWFHAVGPPALGYSWEITAVADDPNLAPVMVIGSGQNMNVTHPHPSFPGTKGTLTIDLSVSTTCGTFDGTFSVPYICRPNGYSVRVDPNPANTQVIVRIVKNDLSSYYITDPNGVQVRIIPSNGGVNSINSRIYTNGQAVSVASLPNGVYSLYVNPADVAEQLSTTVVILR